MNQEKKTWIVGHKNPDTDSICAAIAYADLKNKTENGIFESKRAGHLNEETKYVLDYFQVPVPDFIADVGAQVKDIEFRKTKGVSSHISIKKAWELMRDGNVSTIPVTTKSKKLAGLITKGDIATTYMEVYDNKIVGRARTQYKNILETLEGTLLVGNEHAYFTKGKVVVAAASPEMMEEFIEDNDLVILGNRYEVQLCALEMNAGCIIVCSGAKVSQTIQKLARERGCVFISTPYDTYTVARLINQSMPIKQFMRKENLATFELEDYVEVVKETMSKKRLRYFPVLDEDGTYVGMISRRNLLNMKRKQLILVDHNEKTQAVDGIDGAEILEIIDHHRLGSLETISPVFFRNQPLGSTSTIIYLMYQEKAIEIPQKIAGLLCAAIISDTLMFRSPTCTQVDRKAAQELAIMAAVKVEELARNMFQAGSDFKNKSSEEIFYQDFKMFNISGKDFGVGQISAMSIEELEGAKEKLIPYLKEVLEGKRLNMVYVMLTNILDESTELIYAGEGAFEIVEKAFHNHTVSEDGGLYLKGVISRKKQMIPALMAALQDEKQFLD